MSKLMMDAINYVFYRALKTNDLQEIEKRILELDDEKKIDLLDELIVATMNYGDSDRGPGSSSPDLNPLPSPSGDAGTAHILPQKA